MGENIKMEDKLHYQCLACAWKSPTFNANDLKAGTAALTAFRNVHEPETHADGGSHAQLIIEQS